ncbi:MAG: T9SS type A sorting domain-containing protein [Bacteroidota bacterium]
MLRTILTSLLTVCLLSLSSVVSGQILSQDILWNIDGNTATVSYQVDVNEAVTVLDYTAPIPAGVEIVSVGNAPLSPVGWFRFDSNDPDNYVVFDLVQHTVHFHLEASAGRPQIGTGVVAFKGDITVDIDDISRTARQDIQVFPNPTYGKVQIRGQWDETVSVGLYDMNGQRRMQTTIPAGSPGSLDLGHLPGGLYILRVESTQGKLIYQHRLQKR